MTYVVRAIEPVAAGDVLKRLWAANLPAGGDLEAKLQWFYRDAPHGSGQAFVVDDEAQAVGCAGIGTRTFFDRTAPTPQRRVALFADLAIDRGHRTAMPALALVRAVRAEVARGFELGYGFPNAKAVAVYRRAGYELLGEMPRYVRVLRAQPYLRPRLGQLSRVVGAVIDRPLAALARVVSLPATRDYTLDWPADVDPRFDELWCEARGQLPFACERTSAFLRWRFLRKPGEPHRIAALHSQCTGDLRGYAVLRPGSDGTIHIADLVAADDRALDALLALLVHELTTVGASSIGFRFLGHPRMQRILAQHGFSRRRDTRAIVVTPGMAPLDDLRDPARWYLTDLDEDT